MCISNEALELWLDDNWFAIEVALELLDFEEQSVLLLAEAA